MEFVWSYYPALKGLTNHIHHNVHGEMAYKQIVTTKSPGKFDRVPVLDMTSLPCGLVVENEAVEKNRGKFKSLPYMTLFYDRSLHLIVSQSLLALIGAIRCTVFDAVKWTW